MYIMGLNEGGMGACRLSPFPFPLVLRLPTCTSLTPLAPPPPQLPPFSLKWDAGADTGRRRRAIRRLEGGQAVYHWRGGRRDWRRALEGWGDGLGVWHE